MRSKFIIMTFLSLFTFGCASTPTFKSVDVDEFSAQIEDENTVVVDVRSAEEWAEGHLAKAQYNIDALKENFATQADSILPKDKTIAIYCRSGRRSKAAATKLAEMGFDVIELNGGIISWQEKRLPITK